MLPKSATHPHMESDHARVMKSVPEQANKPQKMATMHETPIGVPNTNSQTKSVSRKLNQDTDGHMA